MLLHPSLPHRDVPPRAHLSAACVPFLFSAPGARRRGAISVCSRLGRPRPRSETNDQRQLGVASGPPAVAQGRTATTIPIEQLQLQRSGDSRAAASDRQRSGANGPRRWALSSRSQHSVETAEGGRNEEKGRQRATGERGQRSDRTRDGRHSQRTHVQRPANSTRRAHCTGRPLSIDRPTLTQRRLAISFCCRLVLQPFRSNATRTTATHIDAPHACVPFCFLSLHSADGTRRP